MKPFREYLTESKKVYEFKVKVAGDLDNDASKKIKLALDRYQVESCSTGKRTPIQESPIDFPDHTNVNVTVFDVTVAYPATSAIIRSAIAEHLKKSLCCVKVRNLKEQEEDDINHQYDEGTCESILNKDYEEGGAQDQVGEKHTMSMLKDLNKVKHELQPYKDSNDKMFAKTSPSEKSEGPAVKDSKSNNISPVGSRQVKLPTAKTAGGR